MIIPKHPDRPVLLDTIHPIHQDRVHQAKDLIEHGVAQGHLRQADHPMNHITLSLGHMRTHELNLLDILELDLSDGHQLDVNHPRALSLRD